MHASQAQETFSVSGTVKDAETGEAMPGVSVYLAGQQKGVVTNENGAYLLETGKGRHEIRYSFLGYKIFILTVSVESKVLKDIFLEPSPIRTKEVTVSGRRPQENLLKNTDEIVISKEEMKDLPYLLGQPDPLKMLQLLPGVQSNGEGNNGIFVRGGAIDQNLILLDKAPVYNTGHLFGFFSLFNHSVIDQVNLIKGGIPASYGGRLSSVLEINTRSGDFKRYRGEGSIGVVAGNFSLEGPLVKDKSSFIICGRRTYIDLLSKLVTRDPTIFNTGIDYFFDDLNLKADFRLSPRNQLAFSAFTGTDDFLFYGKNNLTNSIRWKNHTASVQWNHFYSPKVYHTTSVYGTSYKMDFAAGINEYVFNIHSAIQDYGTKTEWFIETIPDHRLSFGLEYMHHALVPNNIKAQGADVEFTFTEQEKLNNQEEALFINDEFQISDKLMISGGLRLAAYQQLGPFTRYSSDQSMTLQDTIRYRKNETIINYFNLDPRFSAVYQLSEKSSLKAAYDRMHQYLHMAPVSSVSLPTDVWVPSSEKIKPQQGTQYSLGFFHNMLNNSIESSVTAYYKTMNRQIEYRDGVIVGYSKGYNFDDSFIFGKGRSYGLEMFLKKKEGKLTGWLSYTLSRTTRTFEEINQGQTFAAKYDRLHNFSWVNNYKLNSRWTLSGVFTYSTGNALTLPVGRYIISGNIINEYQGRNTFRMPAYHRMDVSASWQAAKRKNFESFLVFSVYNLYNRKNPYYIFFKTEGNVNDYYLKVSLEKVSLFPIIPSIAYQFKF